MTSPDQTLQLPAASGGTGTGTAAFDTAAAGDLAGHAAALQTVLGQLSTVTIAQLVAFFRQYESLPNFQQLLAQAFPQIVTPHAHAAATITAQWYNELDPTSRFAATPTVSLPTQQIDKTLAWALNAPGQTTPVERLAGSTKRMVFDASRDTVLANAKEQGWKWARYASANACAFCRVMATKTNSSRLYNSSGVTIDPDSGNYILTVVGRSGRPRGTQAIGEKYHDHCKCIAVPIPPGQTYTPPDYTDEWSKQYKAAFDAVPDGTHHKQVLPMVLKHMRANTDAH